MPEGPILATPHGAPEPADPLIGRVIAGKFAVIQRLGAGAMGIVYRATQIALERTVAIKVLHREFAADPEFADRFWREAKAASRLDHPNSIRVLDFGQEPDGLLYLAMEYVEGRDLFEWLRASGAISPKSIVDLLSQALAALAVAHDMGVVHRDLKPENIMIVRGTNDEGQAIDIVKVCDFGIAKLLDTASSPTQPPARKHSTGLVVGTPAYMSPEQARGEKQDARSDLYAVGVVLYELLAGSVPFDAETLIGVALKHVGEKPEPPSARAADVDPELEAICLKAISKKPAERYQSAREMRLALQKAASLPGFGAAHSRSPAHRVGSFGRQDSSKPTLVGVTPGAPEPGARHSRAWLALPLVLGAAAVLFVRFHAESRADRAAATLPSAAALGSPPAASPTSEPVAAVDAGNTVAGSVARVAPGTSESKRHRLKGDAAPRVANPEQPQPEMPQGAAPAPARDAPEPALAATSRTLSLAAARPEPSLTPSAPSAPSPPAPPSAPSAPSYDVALARVAIGTARNAAGATAISVTRAVSEAASRITACYKSALPQLSGAVEGADVLHVDTDGAGVITDARLSGPVRGSVAACVSAAVQGHRVANVDTGNASGDVPLSFRAH